MQLTYQKQIQICYGMITIPVELYRTNNIHILPPHTYPMLPDR